MSGRLDDLAFTAVCLALLAAVFGYGLRCELRRARRRRAARQRLRRIRATPGPACGPHKPAQASDPPDPLEHLWALPALTPDHERPQP